MAKFVQDGSKKSSAVVCAFQNATKPCNYSTSSLPGDNYCRPSGKVCTCTVAHRLTYQMLNCEFCDFKRTYLLFLIQMGIGCNPVLYNKRLAEFCPDPELYDEASTMEKSWKAYA